MNVKLTFSNILYIYFLFCFVLQISNGSTQLLKCPLKLDLNKSATHNISIRVRIQLDKQNPSEIRLGYLHFVYIL